MARPPKGAPGQWPGTARRRGDIGTWVSRIETLTGVDRRRGGQTMALELWRPKLMARSPFRELARLEREMDDMFSRFPAWPWGERERGWAPAVDMIDHKDEFVLRADLPGLDDKDIEVTVEDGTVTIRGERKEETEEKKEDYYYSERSYGVFARTLPLPAGVEPDKVRATFKKGVLEVHLPKAKEAKGKKIEIKAA
jgi:HSP20 family protein